MRTVKRFLKGRFPNATACYHRVALFLCSFLAFPFSSRLYVEDTPYKVPIHNAEVYGFSIGGPRVAHGRLYYEEELIAEFKKMAAGKKVFFDVGAHIGYWSYVALSLGMSVAAFEPVSSRSDIIKKMKERYRVPVTVMGEGNCLDAFVSASGMVPDFIKIDVDGAERSVIAGARDLLMRHNPDLMVEVREETMDLVDELKKLGYREVKRSGEDSVCVFLTKNRGNASYERARKK